MKSKHLLIIIVLYYSSSYAQGTFMRPPFATDYLSCDLMAVVKVTKDLHAVENPILLENYYSNAWNLEVRNVLKGNKKLIGKSIVCLAKTMPFGAYPLHLGSTYILLLEYIDIAVNNKSKGLKWDGYYSLTSGAVGMFPYNETSQTLHVNETYFFSDKTIQVGGLLRTSKNHYISLQELEARTKIIDTNSVKKHNVSVRKEHRKALSNRNLSRKSLDSIDLFFNAKYISVKRKGN